MMIISNISLGQNGSSKYYIGNNKDTIYTEPDQRPVFTNELYSLEEYIQTNLKYPKTAFKDNISGTVYLILVVDDKGKVKDVQILKGMRDDLDKEALRIVSKMQKWTPGMVSGRNVSSEYKLPVKFILDK
jgi:protein TonB